MCTELSTFSEITVGSRLKSFMKYDINMIMAFMFFCDGGSTCRGSMPVTLLCLEQYALPDIAGSQLCVDNESLYQRPFSLTQSGALQDHAGPCLQQTALALPVAEFHNIVLLQKS